MATKATVKSPEFKQIVSILCDEEGVWRPNQKSKPKSSNIHVSILCDEEGVWRPNGKPTNGEPTNVSILCDEEGVWRHKNLQKT